MRTSRHDGGGRRLYRDRNGVLLGICKGLARYFDISVFWIRMMALVALLVTGFWPAVIAYLIAAILIKPEPALPLDGEDEAEFYDSYTYSRTNAARRLKRRYESLERRIRRMEDIVTGKEYDWDRRFNDS